MLITLIVHQFLPRYFTGTEQYCLAIAKGLQARGHDVEVFALEPDFADTRPFFEERHELVEGIPVVRFRHWYSLGADFDRLDYHHPLVGARFAAHLRARRPDIVHSFHLRHVGANLLAEARALGIPSVVHLMDFWFVCPAVTLLHRDGSLCEGPPKGGLGCIPCVAPSLAAELTAQPEFRPQPVPTLDATRLPSPADGSLGSRVATFYERPTYLRSQLAHASRVLAPSRFLRDVFVRNGHDPANVDVCTYGIDDAKLADLARTRPPRRADQPLRLGYFGSIAHHKGVDLLVDAVLQCEGPLELAIFGRTTDFPDYAEPLRARAAADARVRFCAPFAREQLRATLASIDVLVVPSRWYENTPFVVLEAFAGGVPVIASDVGGMREIIADEVHGELFVRDDPTDLARRLRRLLAEPDRLARYITALPPSKSLEANLDELEDVYRACRAAPLPR